MNRREFLKGFGAVVLALVTKQRLEADEVVLDEGVIVDEGEVQFQDDDYYTDWTLEHWAGAIFGDCVEIRPGGEVWEYNNGRWSFIGNVRKLDNGHYWPPWVLWYDLEEG